MYLMPGCICLCKDTNFKANHNRSRKCCTKSQVVYAYAKILILKQITTSSLKVNWQREVVYAYAKILILKQITTMQKQGQLIVCCICLCKDTNFKANHNPRAKKVSLPCCCICLCKDTNFKANHNTHNPVKYTGKVVYAYAKILILKQITTMQKQGQLIVCCICLCKDTNFKANHNIAR